MSYFPPRPSAPPPQPLKTSPSLIKFGDAQHSVTCKYKSIQIILTNEAEITVQVFEQKFKFSAESFYPDIKDLIEKWEKDCST